VSALADGNVVWLPTAAPAKVQNPCGPVLWAAKASLPKHPAKYILPGFRDASLSVEEKLAISNAGRRHAERMLPPA
jgi:hypothetical protein